jgi:hypothetical protein
LIAWTNCPDAAAAPGQPRPRPVFPHRAGLFLFVIPGCAKRRLRCAIAHLRIRTPCVFVQHQTLSRQITTTGVMDSRPALGASRNDDCDLKRPIRIRHCKRKRSNPGPQGGRLDCFVASAPRNDGETHILVLAAHCARVLQIRSPPEVRGRRECRVSDAPVAAKNAVVFHRFTGLNRHSLRNGFTVSFVLSPVTGLFCHRRLAKIPRDLTPASGRQDHTTSPYESRAVRLHAQLTSIAPRAQRP